MTETIRILIIDDDEPTRDTLGDVLTEAGYSVEVAANAQEALAAAAQLFHHILLIDIHLPDQSGIDVLHELKRQHPDVEAVMITGHASLENALQSFENASAYVEKPVDIPDLLNKIEEISVRQADRLAQKEIQKQLQQELQFYKDLSNTDRLTQLYNGSYFRQTLADEANRARRYDRSFVVMMLDIDFFKQYNDRHGHVDADDALIELARIFAESKRTSDVVARLGGEEFAFLLPETDTKQAYNFAERLRNQVSETRFPLREQGYGRLTLSIGIAEFPRSASDKTELVRCADQALYRAKHAGRNQTCIYETPDVDS